MSLPGTPTSGKPTSRPDPAGLGDTAADPNAEALSFQVRWQGQRSCVVTVAGELDVATSSELDRAVGEVLEQEPQRLVIDLDRVTFLDSTGLGVLVSAYQRVGAHDGHVALVCHNRSCLKVMEITGLIRVFTLVPSVDQALAGPRAETGPRPGHR